MKEPVKEIVVDAGKTFLKTFLGSIASLLGLIFAAIVCIVVFIWLTDVGGIKTKISNGAERARQSKLADQQTTP